MVTSLLYEFVRFDGDDRPAGDIANIGYRQLGVGSKLHKRNPVHNLSKRR